MSRQLRSPEYTPTPTDRRAGVWWQASRVIGMEKESASTRLDLEWYGLVQRSAAKGNHSFYPRSPYGSPSFIRRRITVNYREARMFGLETAYVQSMRARPRRKPFHRKITADRPARGTGLEDPLYLGNLDANATGAECQGLRRRNAQDIARRSPRRFFVAGKQETKRDRCANSSRLAFAELGAA